MSKVLQAETNRVRSYAAEEEQVRETVGVQSSKEKFFTTRVENTPMRPQGGQTHVATRGPRKKLVVRKDYR